MTSLLDSSLPKSHEIQFVKRKWKVDKTKKTTNVWMIEENCVTSFDVIERSPTDRGWSLSPRTQQTSCYKHKLFSTMKDNENNFTNDTHGIFLRGKLS